MPYHSKLISRRPQSSAAPVFRLAAMALALHTAWLPAQAQTSTENPISFGRDVYASSIRDNNLPELAVDGTLNTRWESAWGKDPQWMYVDLGAVSPITHVAIEWEGAYARAYELQVSNDEIHWQRVGDPITDNTQLHNDIAVNAAARYVRVFGTRRANDAYGYSIREFNVYGANGAGAPLAPAPNIASGKAVTASSIEKDQAGASDQLKPSDYLAQNVTDDNGATRWSSKYSDNEWIQVDLGQSTVIGGVEFDWQDAYGRAYEIQVSDDGANFKTVYRTLGGPGGTDRVALYATGRYVRMQGIGRSRTFGYSMYEFKVFPWREGDAKPVYTFPAVPTPARVAVGKGSYDVDDVTAIEPPPPIYKTDAVKGPVPSNDWWQSLLISNLGAGNSLVSLPLRANYTRSGLGITTLDAGYLNGNSVDTQRDTDLTLRPTGMSTANAVTKVAGYGDYHVDVVLSDDATPKMTTTLVQGSPFVYNTFANPDKVLITAYGLVRLFDRDGNTVLAEDAVPLSADVVGMEVLSTDRGPTPKTSTHYYGLFAPAGSTFMRIGNSLKITLPADQQYLSVATMPQAGDLADFYGRAYAFVTGTKADYGVDLATSQVTTTFNTTTTVKRAGFSDQTMMGLLPHQWKTSGDARLDGRVFPSVRGDIKLMDGNAFTTVNRFHGLIPNFVEPTNPEYSRARLAGYLDQLDQDVANNPVGDEPYWQGKKLHPLALGIIAADQAGDAARRDRYIAKLRAILVDWLTYSPNEQGKTYFHYVRSWGTLVSRNSEFGVNFNLSDHHFTYGYFTFAAGVLASYDKSFASDYGGMVETLLRDYANPSRTDAQFPYMRNFNPYSGHSWAGGYGDNQSGNNQEAAGEALFSWVGEYLWGVATSQAKWRDAGIYGFTTEEKSVEQYWFNYDRDNWLPEWTHGSVGQIYGAANAFITFFNGAPTYVYGIHWLPPAEWMTYYGREPDKAAALYQSFVRDNGGPETDWQNIVWPFQSISDPAAVLAKFDGSKVQANEAFNAYWFANAMASLGHRSNDIWSVNWPAATVYQGPNGYTAQVWNPTDTDKTVQFSNGSGITGSAVVPAHATIRVDPTRTVTTAPVLPAPVDPYVPVAGSSVTTFAQNGEAVANMLDGDQNTRWSSGQTQQPGQWVQIDLKSVTAFDTLFVGAGNTGDYARGYQILLSLDGTTWSDPVASGNGEASLVLSLGPQKARFIRIVNTATSDRWWSITEVKVANFGKPAQPAQPALPAPTGVLDRSGWTVQASSRFARDPEQNMLDGSRDTIWSSAMAQVPGEWIWVDMGASQYVDTVVIDAAGRTGDYPRGVDVFVSDESAAWGEPVYSASNLASQRVAATFAPVKGRYLGIKQTGNADNWWSVAELTAAYNGTGALTEIAPSGWTASASVTGGTEAAGRALDGKPDTRWTSGAPQAAGQWFQIDLGSVQAVKQIDLDANSGDYPRAFEVRLSQDGQTWSEPVAQGTGKDAYVSIPLGRHDARFIRVVQTGSADAWWSVAEAKVFR